MNQAAVKRNPVWQSKYNCDILIRSAQTESLSFFNFFFFERNSNFWKLNDLEEIQLLI